MEENEKMNERIKDLENKIKIWREELDTIWGDNLTEKAIEERRNLQNLISNAEQEITEIRKNRGISNESNEPLNQGESNEPLNQEPSKPVNQGEPNKKKNQGAQQKNNNKKDSEKNKENQIISIEDLFELVKYRNQRHSILDEINQIKDNFKDESLSAQFDTINTDLEVANKALEEMSEPNERRQQEKYIEELESQKAKIQKEIDEKKSAALENLNNELKGINEKEDKIKKGFDENKQRRLDKINSEFENIKQQRDYFEKQKNDANESLNSADESLKETYSDVIKECEDSLIDLQSKQNEFENEKSQIDNLNLDTLIERASYSQELINKINEENKRINAELSNDINTIINNKELKQNELLKNNILKSIFDNELDNESLKKVINSTLNNFNRKNQTINVGGYNMTRGQALEELSSLYARLENEDFLDTIDDPDYNEQAILDRIALLEDALGVSLDSNQTPEKNPPPGKNPNPEKNPPPGKNPPPEQTPPPSKNALVKSGLQIFREEFNKMPDIKRKHTATERLPFYQALLGIGGITAITLANPIVGIPMIAATPFLKPIIKGLTGQGKLENEIAKQFRDLKNTNPAEFDRMIDYLSEEQIQDLKPNAVILNALHKVSIERTAEQIKELQIETSDLESRKNAILSKNGSEQLTEEEKEDLNAINNRLIEIKEGSHYTDNFGKEVYIEGEADRIQRRYKDLKRGKDRVSQRYKGNLLTRFNIFAHRNTDSEIYRKPLNELADAELARDKARVDGDSYTVAVQQKNMDEVMTKNTGTNALGIQNSVFNARTGNVRIMSDRIDNTNKNMITIASVFATIFAAAQIANKVKVNVTGDKDLAQKAADAEQANIYAQGETAAVREMKSTQAPGYEGMDKLANELGNQAGIKIQSNKLADQMRALGNQIGRNGQDSAHLLQRASRESANVNYSVDHAQQIGVESSLVENTAARAQILKNAADLIDKLEKSGNEVVQKAFVAPILAGIAAAQRIGSEIVNNYREQRDNTNANGR